MCEVFKNKFIKLGSLLIVLNFASQSYLFPFPVFADELDFLSGGFPDVKFMRGGVVLPHSERNPATLILFSKYDIALSFGFGERIKNAVGVRITDSSTSKIAGELTFKCISSDFPCSKRISNIFGVGLAYPFSPTTSILGGVGVSLRSILSDGYGIFGGRERIFFTAGGILSLMRKDFDVIGGLSISASTLGEIIGGIGGGIYTPDIFAFSEALFISEYFKFDDFSFVSGIVIRALDWFRLGAGGGYRLSTKNGTFTISGGFVSPRLYIWLGYHTGKIWISSIGIAF